MKNKEEKSYQSQILFSDSFIAFCTPDQYIKRLKLLNNVPEENNTPIVNNNKMSVSLRNPPPAGIQYYGK